MMNSLTITFILLFFSIPYNSSLLSEEKTSLFDFYAKDLAGKTISFTKYRNKVVLIVNVASECGFTKSNYEQLNRLYEKHHENGLEIVAFPCNQFGAQEPGNNEEIKRFLKKNNVRFDVYSKVTVNGDQAHPLFEWLKTQLPGLLNTGWIKWNFTKFLLDHNGQPLKRYGPNEQPDSIEPDLEYALEKLKHASLKRTHAQEL